MTKEDRMQWQAAWQLLKEAWAELMRTILDDPLSAAVVLGPPALVMTWAVYLVLEALARRISF